MSEYDWKVNQFHHSIQTFIDQPPPAAALHSSILHFTQFLCRFDAERCADWWDHRILLRKALTWNLLQTDFEVVTQSVDCQNSFIGSWWECNLIWCHRKHSMPWHTMLSQSIQPRASFPKVYKKTKGQVYVVAFWYRRRANDICDNICAQSRHSLPIPAGLVVACNRCSTIRDCCQPTPPCVVALDGSSQGLTLAWVYV